MRSTTVTLLLTTLFSNTPAVVTAFVPSFHGNAVATDSSRHRLHVTMKPDPMNEALIDMNYAKYCADHPDECALEDMERIRNGECVML